jgi:hypothetical protein
MQRIQGITSEYINHTTISSSTCVWPSHVIWGFVSFLPLISGSENRNLSLMLYSHRSDELIKKNLQWFNFVCVCVFERACVSVCVYAYVWARVCAHMCERVCVRICVCVCVRACVLKTWFFKWFFIAVYCICKEPPYILNYSWFFLFFFPRENF